MWRGVCERVCVRCLSPPPVVQAAKAGRVESHPTEEQIWRGFGNLWKGLCSRSYQSWWGLVGHPAPLQTRVSCSDVCVCACSVSQSCLTLCDPTDSSPPGCSVHGISQARLLQWAAISFSRGIFLTQGSNLQVLCLLLCQGVFFTSEPPGKPWCLSLNINLNLCLEHLRLISHQRVFLTNVLCVFADLPKCYCLIFVLGLSD